MPPLLSASRMFWWGVGLYGVRLLVETAFYLELWVFLGSSPWLNPVRILLIAAGDIGLGLIVGSIILRALSGRERPQEIRAGRIPSSSLGPGSEAAPD